jgi:Acetyl-CoA dehydrogenase C-terminal like
MSHADVEFYRGKVLAAKYFASYVLPQTHARVKAIVGGDRSPLDIPDGGFASPR